MKDLEKIYDEEISPLMAEIIAVSKRRGIPMMALFQLNDDCTCYTRLPQDDEHAVFRNLNAMYASREGNGVNIDKFFRWIERLAKEHGHGSVYLSRLGISTTPNEENAKNEGLDAPERKL